MVAIENDRPYPRELIAEVTPVSSLERTPVNNRASFVVFTAPSFASMDEPSEWSVVPSGQLQSNNNATSGEFSLTNPQCGWFALVSPLFDAAEWEMVGSKLAIDVYVPTNVSNPQWVGDVQMRLKSAASGVHDAYLGYHSLTTLPRGAWSTLEFSLTPTAFQLIDLDRPSIRLQIDVNNGVCNGGLLLDNLRLTGNGRIRSEFHQSTGGGPVSSGDFMSFDHAGDWQATAPVQVVSTPRVEGSGALLVQSDTWVTLLSQPFNTSDVGSVSARLSVDVQLAAPPANPYWLGTLQAFLSCPSAGLHNTYIGQRSLGQVFFDEYNAVVFDLPAQVQSTLSDSHDDCRLRLDFAGNPMPEGVLFDNMGFVP